MKCQGKFKFKSIEKKPAGEFKNARGELIKYNESYSLKVDEITDNNYYERIFKISIDNIDLVNSLSSLKAYDDIILEFDVILSNIASRLVPVKLLNVNK